MEEGSSAASPLPYVVPLLTEVRPHMTQNTTMTSSSLSTIPEILEDLRAGKPIVLVDDEGRENEGDFVVAAEHIDVAAINFMTRVGAGYLCVAMTGEDCDRLDLGPQAQVNTSLRTTAFTVSIDGHPRHGVGTGISSADRTKTIQMLADPSRPVRPVRCLSGPRDYGCEPKTDGPSADETDDCIAVAVAVGRELCCRRCPLQLQLALAFAGRLHPFRRGEEGSPSCK